MEEKTITEWYENNDNKDYFLYVPPMKAQEAINFLERYLLGDDWYIVAPVNNEQANTIIVHEILNKYSKKYKKEKRGLNGRKNKKIRKRNSR